MSLWSAAEALVEADYHRRLLAMQVYGRDAKDYLMILYDAMKAVFGELNLDYREWVDLPRSALDTHTLERELITLGNKVEKAQYKQLIETAKANQTLFISESGLKYDVKMVLGSFLSVDAQARQGIINHFYGANPTLSQIEEQHMSEQNTTIIGSTIHGAVITAESIHNSFNALQSSTADTAVKTLLSQLLSEIQTLNSKIPEAQSAIVQNMAEETEALIAESSREQPRKRWYQASIEGIKDAAITLHAIGEPILKLANDLGDLLL